ncbi:MAG TPA: glycosyltransferase family 4 protein [Anaerolineales bacterium]|nr:glycosyltransferase family 4 protein [Anaerolineales bacterium]
MRVGLLHYSGPPTIGGVESTMAHQARFLVAAGWRPRLLVGSGEAFDERLELRCLPRLSSTDPEVLEVKAELDVGRVTSRFEALRSVIRDDLRQATGDLDAMIVHNALSLHKNLALTAALWDLWRERAWPKLIAWHHDLAWDRSDYIDQLHPGEPWGLLRSAWPGAAQVTVSDSTRDRWAALTRLPPKSVHVIPPGVDPAGFGRWTEQTNRIYASLALEMADIVLLLPSRITRRKNIEFAIEVLGAMRQKSALDARLLITGPPGPHNPANRGYLDDLLEARRRLRLDMAVHFLYRLEPEEPEPLEEATVADLFQMADALLFPSLDEGFGIPILEAGLARLPVFCSDIAPLRETGGVEVHRFRLEASPAEVAADILDTLMHDAAYRLRRRVLGSYTWSQLLRRRLLPLLEGPADA